MTRARCAVGGLSLVASIVWLGCAAVQEPPGGPPDFTAPVLLSVAPESGSVRPGFERPLRFQFDEIVSEAQGRLGEFLLVSPKPREVDIGWKRDAIDVRPDGGWRPNTVYHVTLLPGVQDLRNNRTREPAHVVFTTGGPVPDTRLEGTLLNWQEGRPGRRGLIEAILMPDSLVYVAQADSAGDFLLTALPPGTYTVLGVVDGDNNRRRGMREPYDSAVVRLDSVATQDLWAFVHDTAGPQLRTAERVDSMTIRAVFNQRLEPVDPDSGAVRVSLLPDTVLVPVAAVWRPAVWDSVRAAEAAEAAARAAAQDTAAADTVARADTVAVADTAQFADPDARERPDTAGVAQDTSRAQRLLATRPPLADAWVIRLGLALTPGSRYLVEATATNPNGATATSRILLILPEAPPDTAAADTAAADTTRNRERRP